MVKSTTPDFRGIEEKFSQTAFRLTQERNDFLLPQIIDFVRERRWMNLRPEYQRRTVWDDAKRSLFIESLLLNVPIPPVFLYEYDLSRYEVMDGQQRLSTIVDFYENRFALKKLDKWHELHGFRYGDLPESLRRGLDRRRLSATVLLIDNSAASPSRGDVRKLVFERLNTGGQHLNQQELRNCLYDGSFNQLLIRLAQEPIFTELWGIPPYSKNVDRHGNISPALRENRLYKRMEDCQIILRFFALRKRTNIRGSVRSMLDRYMEHNTNPTDSEVAQMEQDFLSRLQVARDIFGPDRVFRYEDEKQKLRLSQTVYDGVMVAIDRLWDQRQKMLTTRRRLVQNVEQLLRDRNAYEVIIGRPNTAEAVQRRLDLLEDAMRP